MILSLVKSQLDGNNVREIILQRLWHTQLKHSMSCTVILHKLKNPPDGFCTHLFFASSIILIFGGTFLYRISRILKVNLKWLRVQTTDFSIQKMNNKEGEYKFK